MNSEPGAGGAGARAPSDSPRGESSGRSLRATWERTIEVLRAPRVTIELFGGDQARAVFDAFTAPHPRFRVTSAKRWGVALLRLPASAEAYSSATSRLVRRRRKHAEDAGYRYALVAPLPYLDDIIAVNRSAPSRQGRPMGAKFQDRGYVAATVGAHSTIHAILDSEGRLRAYSVVIDAGDAFTFSAMIGHADDLQQGIMYLLMGEVVRDCIDARRSDGTPSWLVYDTFWGASAGLAFFKRRTGYGPHTVRWLWRDGGKPGPALV